MELYIAPTTPNIFPMANTYSFWHIYNSHNFARSRPRRQNQVTYRYSLRNLFKFGTPSLLQPTHVHYPGIADAPRPMFAKKPSHTGHRLKPKRSPNGWSKPGQGAQSTPKKTVFTRAPHRKLLHPPLPCEQKGCHLAWSTHAHAHAPA